MEGISMMPLSGDSNDKRLEKTFPIKLQNEPRSEKRVGDIYNNGVACNSPNAKVEDNSQEMELGSVESSTASMLKNESLHVKSDSGPKRKLKKLTNCQIRNMAIGLKIFRESLGLRKKHKRSMRRIIDSKNFSKELYSERDCSSSDVGPSNSYSTSRIHSSYHSRKKAANGTAQKNAKPRNGDSSMNSIDGELREGSNLNGAVLAADGQLPKCSDSLLEASPLDAVEHGSCKDGRKDALQEGMSKLTRGLEETTITRWDGIDLHPRNVESKGTESLSIGYVLDDWDEEYDRGKRKKLRQNMYRIGGPNPFQEIAN